MTLLIFCLQYEKKSTRLLNYLQTINLTLEETLITLSYCEFGSSQVLSTTFAISQSSKVKDAINFYDAMLNLLGSVYEAVTTCSVYFVYLELLIAFRDFKKTFIAFADL